MNFYDAIVLIIAYNEAIKVLLMFDYNWQKSAVTIYN